MTHVHHINLLVDDLDAAVEFYETILGFPKCPTPEFDFPAQFVAIGAEQEIHINQLDDVKPQIGHFAVRLDNFNEVFMTAYEAGVLETEAWGQARKLPNGVIQSWVRDPSGNLVEINSNVGDEVDPAIFELDVFDRSSL